MLMKPIFYTIVRVFAFTAILFSAPQVMASNFFNTNTSAFEEPEFLKVDKAFQFRELVTDSGILVSWNIAPDYYLYKDRIIVKTDNPDIKVKSLAFSQAGEEKNDPNFGIVTVFHDYIELHINLSVPEDSLSKEAVTFTISYQGCADAGLCYPPQKRTIAYTHAKSNLQEQASSNRPVNPSKINATSNINALETSTGIFGFLESASFGKILITFFLLGLGLTFTPCVLPMIPIITAIISGQKEKSFTSSLILAISYVLGMALTYAAAGVIMGLIGASANLQAQLQSPVALSLFALLFILLALAMFGAYELQLPAFLRDRLNNRSQNISGGKIGGVFAIGAISALVVSPCVSAPLAGSLIYISTTEDALLGGMALLSLGFGMGTPLIVIAVGGDKLIPKAGIWMENTKKFFGFMLLGLAIWLLERLISPSLAMTLWGLLLAFATVHLGAFDKAESGIAKTFKTITLLGFAYAIAILMGALNGNHNPLNPLEFSQSTSNQQINRESQTPFTIIESLPELETEIEKGVLSGKITLLDFYADWCVSCKVMEKEVFSSPEVSDIIAHMNLVQADVTEVNQQTTTLLEEHNLFGPPSILFFDDKGDEISSLRIQGEVNKSTFLQILERLPASVTAP